METEKSWERSGFGLMAKGHIIKIRSEDASYSEGYKKLSMKKRREAGYS